MTLNEYAIKLGLSLNACQMQLLDLIEERKDESLIISFPRLSGRQLMYNLIERKKGYDEGYEQGRAEGYSKAENDYFAQSQKDREDTYNCGYAIGRQDVLGEVKQLRAEIAEMRCERQAEFAFMTEHEAQIRADVIEECIKVISEADVDIEPGEDILIKAIEQLKE